MLLASRRHRGCHIGALAEDSLASSRQYTLHTVLTATAPSISKTLPTMLSIVTSIRHIDIARNADRHDVMVARLRVHRKSAGLEKRRVWAGKGGIFRGCTFQGPVNVYARSRSRSRTPLVPDVKSEGHDEAHVVTLCSY
jgi:hypothetical protein